MSWWPVVVDRLLELLPTLPGYSDVEVLDGPPDDASTSGRYVTVGWVEGAEAGGYTTSRAGSGFQVIEDGTVRCAFVVNTRPLGLETPMATVRAGSFAMLDALRDAIRDDQTLGVLPPASTCEVDVDVQSLATTAGSAQALIVTIIYQTTS